MNPTPQIGQEEGTLSDVFIEYVVSVSRQLKAANELCSLSRHWTILSVEFFLFKVSFRGTAVTRALFALLLS